MNPLSNFMKQKENTDIKGKAEGVGTPNAVGTLSGIFGSKNNMKLIRKKEKDIDYDKIASIEELPFNDLRISVDWPGKKSGTKRPPVLFTPEGLEKENFRNQYLPERFLKEIEGIEEKIFQIKEQKGENKYSRLGRKSYMDGIVNYGHLRLRYAMTMTSQGELWAILRLIPDIIPRIEDLGLVNEACEHIKKVSTEKDGLILFCGATGAGKTTTMASVVQNVTEEKGAFTYTIEDPCEYMLHGPHGSNGYCIQTEAEDHGGWINGVVNALRSKPDCLVLGEIREAEVAKMAIRAAQTGHLVMSTLHAGSLADAMDSIIRLADGSDSTSIRDQVAQRLRAIVYQTREGDSTNIKILDFTKEVNKKNLINVIKNDKTSALDESWADNYSNTKEEEN